MLAVYSVLTILLCVFRQGAGQTPPTITVTPATASMSKSVTIDTQLSTIGCTDAEDSTTILFDSAVPNTCAGCWEVITCVPDECLQFKAGTGPPDVGSYTLTVSCTANTDTVTETVTVTVTSEPELTVTPAATSMEVDQATDLQLSTLTCSDEDGDPPVITMTTNPNDCPGCFVTETCGADECLTFKAAAGPPTLGAYTMTVSCTAGGVTVSETVVVTVNSKAQQETSGQC